MDAELQLTCRPARDEDLMRVFEWANDPAVRAASFRSEPIPLDVHRQWFARQLAEEDRMLLIVERDDAAGRVPVGQFRFDAGSEEVSVSVAESFRGRGMGAAVIRAGLEYLRLINWKVAWSATQGKLDVADASTTKVFGTEFYLESFRLLMEIIGPQAYLKYDSPESIKGHNHLEVLYRGLLILTFGGGTNEIQRDLISLFGLGFPRAPRV